MARRPVECPAQADRCAGSAAAGAWVHHAGGRDVDFVVVGFGLGALGVLLGVGMLGWLAPRSQRAAARASSPDDAARRQAVAAEHRGTGQAFFYAGGAMLLATVAALVASLDDRTGAFLVTTTATVAAVGILLAGYLQRARNPAPPRRRTHSAPAASASIVTNPPPVDIPLFLADESPWTQELVPTESGVEGSHSEILPGGDASGEAIIAADTTRLPPAASSELSSGANHPDDPLEDSPKAMERLDSGSWQLAGSAAGNESDDTGSAETGDARVVGRLAPTARRTESSPSRPDEEDPSSGHQS
jgi:hypothetical protein